MSGEFIHIVYLGLGSFPGYLAEEQRARLIAKGLVQSGCKVTFIVRGGMARKIRKGEPSGHEVNSRGSRMSSLVVLLTDPLPGCEEKF